MVSAKEVKQVVEGIPKDMPILIDEAYHHFVDDPAYGTAVPYILEGRPVIVARTFSKIAALAAMRIGYAVAPADMIQRMRPYAMNSVNVLAKYGAAASLKDSAGQAEVRRKIIALRNSTSKELEAWGYPVIPSQTNFFMVSLHDKTVQPTIAAFREKNILVGRPFPPMLNHLRVSIGRDEDMAKFLVAFKEIFPKARGGHQHRGPGAALVAASTDRSRGPADTRRPFRLYAVSRGGRCRWRCVRDSPSEARPAVTVRAISRAGSRSGIASPEAVRNRPSGTPTVAPDSTGDVSVSR